MDIGIYKDVERTEQRIFKSNGKTCRLYRATCSVCGQIIYKEIVDIKANCKQCHHKKNHTINGYKEVLKPDHHLARSNGYVYEHQLVAEEILGRELKDGEVVHHKDFDRANNNPNNLLIFESCNGHALFHSLLKLNIDINILLNYVYMKDKDLIRFYIKKQREESLIKIKNNKDLHISESGKVVAYCIKCKKEIIPNTKHGLCAKCVHETQRKVERPTKEQLEQDLKEIHNFLAISRKYGVSDNAIRKWCKSYGLPYRTKDLNTYYL